MNSQSGLLSLWTQGDIVTRAVALLLLTMSLASWMVILVKALGLRQMSVQARAVEGFWHASDLNAGVQQLGGDVTNPFRQLALKGQEADAHLQPEEGNRQLIDSLDRNDWVTRCLRSSIDESTTHLQSGLAVLASVGSTAPFVGLFGTVWGIMEAFSAVSVMQSASIQTLAPGVSAALLTTIAGLVVAIPSVFGYNILLGHAKTMITELENYASNLADRIELEAK